MTVDMTNPTVLSFTILPIDLRSGNYADQISQIRLPESNSNGVINSSGYFVFTDLDKSSSYRIIVESKAYIRYRNEIDLALVDYDERVNPNFESMLNGQPEHDQRFKKSDPSIFVYLTDLAHLNALIKDRQENFLIKNITAYPSKSTQLKVIITKLKNNSYNFYHDGYLEDNEVSFEQAEVSLRKEVGIGGPINDIVINPEQINKNMYEFLGLDGHSISSDILDSKTILRKRKYIKFEDTPQDTNIEDVQININILKDSKDIVVPKIVLEKQMTTMINILIID